MKKLILSVLFIFVVAFSCDLDTSGEGVVLFFEDFETSVRAAYPWTYSAGNGIAGSRTGGIGDTLEKDGVTNSLIPGEENFALKLSPNSPNPRGVQLNFKSIAGGKAVLEFDWYLGSSSGLGRLAIQDSHTFAFSSSQTEDDTASYANMFIIFEVNGGNLYHYLGNIKDFETRGNQIPADSYYELPDVSLGKWYRVSITLDFAARTISYVFIESSTGDVVVPAKEFKFNSSVSYLPQLASIRFFSNGADWVNYLDNVKLTGTPSDTSGYYDNDIPYQPGYTNDNF
jgi:hypothetical protein